MSNLKLPMMTFESLMRSGHTKTLAYATTAELVPSDDNGKTDDYIVIRHHGTVIAEIAGQWVYVTNAGYDSSTTRSRIHKILSDNGNFGVTQRQHVQHLITNLRGEREHIALADRYNIIIRYTSERGFVLTSHTSR
jgi:hypothetical protein